MNDKYFFSVLIPNINLTKYLSECLNSIANQTTKSKFNFEVIILDQSSEKVFNDIYNLIRENYDLNMFKVVNTQEFKNVYLARHRLLNLANGEYIVFIDSDDYVSNDFLYNLYIRLYNSEYPDILIHNFNYFNNDNKFTISDSIPKKCDVLAFLDMFYYSAIFNSLCLKCFKKKLYNSQNYTYDEITIGDDWLISLPIVKNAKSISIDTSLFGYFYRQNLSSVTHNSFKFGMEQLTYREEFTANNPPKTKFQSSLYISMIVNSCSDILNSCFKNTYINYKIFKDILRESHRMIKLSKKRILNKLSFKQKILYLLIILHLSPILYIFLKFKFRGRKEHVKK